jgi:hypothetical protein
MWLSLPLTTTGSEWEGARCNAPSPTLACCLDPSLVPSSKRPHALLHSSPDVPPIPGAPIMKPRWRMTLSPRGCRYSSCWLERWCKRAFLPPPHPETPQYLAHTRQALSIYWTESGCNVPTEVRGRRGTSILQVEYPPGLASTLLAGLASGGQAHRSSRTHRRRPTNQTARQPAWSTQTRPVDGRHCSTSIIIS